MNKKQILVWAAVIAILGVLVYLQFRTWRRFDWGVFWQETRQASLLHILIAVGLIYCTYMLRAWRWKIFLKPVCEAKFSKALGPQFIGFAGLALLGRPGELIRPYIIAKKENLTFSSQMAVWAVERIFDIGAFTVLVTVDIFTMDFAAHPTLRQFEPALRKAGFVLIAVELALVIGAYLVRRNTIGVANWFQDRLSTIAPGMARSLCARLRAFGEGLNTIHDAPSFTQLAGLSLLIWFLIALAYRAIMHAYPVPLRSMEVSHVLLLMGASMVGSMLQLPAVGGGSQLATISMMINVFGVIHELAVSAGILLWAVTFMAVIPVGLALAHFEHVSLRKLSRESHVEEEAQPAAT